MIGNNGELPEIVVAAETTIVKIAAVWIVKYTQSWPYWAPIVVLAGCIGHWL